MIKEAVRVGTGEAVVVGPVAEDLPADASAQAANLDALAGVLTRGGFPAESTMVDIGTDYGLSTLLLARAVPRGRVMAFGLSAAALARSRANLDANAVSNVDLVDASTPVPAIDDHLPRLSSVSLLRIAFNGREPEVLDGARALIDRDDPTIFIEFNAWTLNAYGDHSPSAFARTLWRTFVVHRLGPDGRMREAPDDPLRFLYENLLEEACVSELVLRKRPGLRLADEHPLSITAEDARRLRAELAAMSRSTSWRVTRPVRWIKRRLGGP